MDIETIKRTAMKILTTIGICILRLLKRFFIIYPNNYI
ncbi:hypothetical protein BHWA1_01936 [Brachyspira hyodysenteriae WA1]|uniref:Uncharacterized protein n=1 Tax=Brachyspira hyodysenteriae (strain ATCC 49526 / WA1) TaxID=565034 RepID=A0A3B6VCE1_BRAHW|nr:hypothetical protein BHWA1_01936 [Brachyspira hyodysenteriae WA1]